MRRGFKTQAERTAEKLRCDFGLAHLDRLAPRDFLKSLNIIVWEPSDIPGVEPETILQLCSKDPNSWSGVTIKEGNSIAIIVNPTHPSTRQANTLMHEWAHLELRHKPNRVDRSEAGLLLLSDYPSEFEDEADWMAGAILLPRSGLLHFRKRGLNSDQIASHYGVSRDLANWRLRMTGVEKQLRARR
ncbi:MAG: ImmA/IrrE family metallo-endopeptidase [Pseudomonadales bacterium]